MGNILYNRSTNIIKLYMENQLKADSVVIDCTMGNGHDSLYAKELMGKSGKLYGFDIQAMALEKSKILLEAHNLSDHVFYIKDSHEHVDQYVTEKVDLIMFNFGFLPGGDKSITTFFESSSTAIKKSFDLLKQYGIITMIFYPGHEEGKRELLQIMSDLEKIDQRDFDIHHGRFINQINNPPEYVVIQKRTR